MKRAPVQRINQIAIPTVIIFASIISAIARTA